MLCKIAFVLCRTIYILCRTTFIVKLLLFFVELRSVGILQAEKGKGCAQNCACKVQNGKYQQVALPLGFLLEKHSQGNSAVGNKPCHKGGQVDDVFRVHASQHHTA